MVTCFGGNVINFTSQGQVSHPGMSRGVSGKSGHGQAMSSGGHYLDSHGLSYSGRGTNPIVVKGS